MKKLLEYLLRYLDFLYIAPHHRFIDSRSSGHESINAWIVIQGPQMKWMLSNDRGQVRLSVTPAIDIANSHWYGLTKVQQLLEGGPEIAPTMLNRSNSQWLRENMNRVEELFSDEPRARATCAALEDILTANAEARWGPAPSRRDSNE